MAMPWSHQGDDERRFRKILITLMTLALGFAALAPFIKLPPLDKNKMEPIPERIVELIKKKQALPPEPKPVEKKDEKKGEKPTEKKEEKPAEKQVEKKQEPAPTKEAPPAVPDTQVARAKAETKGVLAFRNNFADLLQDTTPAKQDADVRISNSGRQAAAGEPAQRSLITAQGGGSGGINTSNLSRQVAGNSAQAITAAGSKFARVESAIGSGADRPLSKGSGPARTDEEIQIVFDKYKTALDRIYQRELRNDPSLSGRIELIITIEPDGHVSACSVKSSDLASATLKDDVVERVKKFSFGAKEGVPSIKIVFPVDFHPQN
jgi:TonB family protein